MGTFYYNCTCHRELFVCFLCQRCHFPETTHPLVESSAAEKGELDLEGAAWMDGWFYAVGSHNSRSSSREVVFRFQIPDSSPELLNLSEASLSELFQNDAQLQEYFRRSIDLGGLNVEGLAAKDGSLFSDYAGRILMEMYMLSRYLQRGFLTNQSMAIDCMSWL